MKNTRFLSRQTLLILTTLLVTGTQAGCLSWFSDRVATGVARLSVRNVATMVTAISADTECGFSNPDVLTNYVYDTDIGDTGTGTWSVTNCILNFKEWTTLSSDCDGNQTRVKGKVTITADKIVTGRLTGNPEKPVVPITSEAVLFRIHKAVSDDFKVEKSNSNSWMEMKNGSISADMQIKLVESESDGLCTVPTPNVQLTNLRYTRSDVFVHTPDNEFDAEVEESLIHAVNGVFGTQENQLSGTVKVFGKTEDVPRAGDTEGLDPDYNEAAFKSYYACTEDLKLPEAASCDLTDRLGEAGARLTIRNFGTLAKYMASETRCGFDSPRVKSTPEVYGVVGDPNGQVTYRMSNCRINFPQLTPVFEDCNGDTVSIQGAATVSGTKVVTGYITGDPDAPVVPHSTLPGKITIEARLRNFQVVDSWSAKSLSLKSGALSGSLTPRMMIDTETGVCSVPTANALFDNINLQDATARLNSSGNFIDMTLDDVNLTAVNGRVNDKENFLEGSVVVDGKPLVVPLRATERLLDPDYHRLAFIDTYRCTPDTRIPAREEDCSFRDVLAQGAARLLVKNFGMVTKAVDLDNKCGFGNTMDLLGGLMETELLLAYGANLPYTASWGVNFCSLNHTGDTPNTPGFALDPFTVETDCENTALVIEGQAIVSGTKEVVGMVALDYPPLQPFHRQGAIFRFSEIEFDEFAAYEVREGTTEPAGPYLIIHNGVMTGRSRPVTGEAESHPGAYFIKTPVSGFENISIRGTSGGAASATLKLGAKTFNFELRQSDLDAFNGSFNGHENSLRGTVTFDGYHVRLPIDEEDTSLNPDYDQAAFDATYSCKENLKEVVPHSPQSP